MPREHKYRAWYQGQMYFVAELEFDAAGVSFVALVNADGEYTYEGKAGLPFELMEYIGRNDSKEQEIYAGDIIGDNPEGMFKSIVKRGIADIGATTFDDKHFPSWTIGFYAEYDGEPDREMTNLLSQGDVIVVGNIYEHSHLLEDRKDTI